jgi:hypothetical protein
MDITMHSLGAILASINQLPPHYALYLEGNKPWKESSRGAVLNSNDIEDLDRDDRPRFAIEHGLKYTLSVADVRDIIDNTKQQKQNASISDILEAFNYYYDNDAFITW